MKRKKLNKREEVINTPCMYVPQKDEAGTQRTPWLRIILDIDMVTKEGAGIGYMDRKIVSNYRMIYHDRVSMDNYLTHRSPLNDFEMWVRGIDLTKKPEGRENGASDRGNLLGRFKRFWRKLFFQNVDLKQ